MKPKWTEKIRLNKILKIILRILIKNQENLYMDQWWNYGFIHKHMKILIIAWLGKGDGDPIEIGSKQYQTGDIIPVKIIGVNDWRWWNK